MHKVLPSQARLKELLDYDPLAGGLVWKYGRGSRGAGAPAGTNSNNPFRYRMVAISGEAYPAHRIIWMWMTGDDPGDMEVDHIDRDRHNNRWDNLRLATVSQNRANCGCKSRSGLPKGVKKNRDGFGARITMNKVVHWLGTFETAELAHQAYRKAAADLHGEFAA